MNDKVGGVGSGVKNNTSKGTSDLRAGGFNPLAGKPIDSKVLHNSAGTLFSTTDVSKMLDERKLPKPAFLNTGKPRQTHFPNV